MTADRAYDRALRLLASRARSTVELRRSLLRGGEDASSVDAVLTRLAELGLLNDADFALQFARVRLVAAGSSRRRIVQELARRGVARELAESAIRELQESDGVDASAAARRVAEKKWRTLGSVDDLTRRRRLYAFLARRGFDPDEIRTVMQDLGAGE